MTSVTYGRRLFVAVGYEYVPGSYRGVIWTSPDGRAWTKQFSAPGLYFRNVAYGNHTFVAVSGIESICSPRCSQSPCVDHGASGIGSG